MSTVMLLRRTARLSAAVRGQAFRSPGSFLARVTANAHTDSAPHLAGRQRDARPARGSATAAWGRWDRAAAGAGGGDSDVARRAGCLFASVPGRPGGTARTGASTAAAAAKKSEERTADGDKANEEHLKESSATSSSTDKNPGEPEPEEGQPTKKQQLKKFFKEYGAVGVSFHIGISLMSLGMFYLLVSSGIDMAAVLCKLGFSEAIVHSKMAAGTSTFVLAYAIHKLFAPVRISITLVSVPLIVRYFRKTGLFKP